MFKFAAWHEDALCVGKHELFDLDDNNIQLNLKDAIELCSFCPVRNRCLEEAFEQDAYGVIRGGVVFDGSLVNGKQRL